MMSTDRPTRGLGQTHRDSLEVAHEQDAASTRRDPEREAHSICDRCRDARPARRAAALREDGSRHRGIGESHLRLRRLPAVQVVVPRFLIPRIRIPLLRWRHLQPELRVERHRRIEVLDRSDCRIARQSRMGWPGTVPEIVCATDECDRFLRLRDDRAQRGNEHRESSGNGLHGVESVTIPVRYLMKRTR